MQYNISAVILKTNNFFLFLNIYYIIIHLNVGLKKMSAMDDIIAVTRILKIREGHK